MDYDIGGNKMIYKEYDKYGLLSRREIRTSSRIISAAMDYVTSASECLLGGESLRYPHETIISFLKWGNIDE